MQALVRDPLPLAKRAFESSNFLVLYNMFNDRLAEIGKFPCMYALTAAKELVRWHMRQYAGSETSLSKFQQMFEQVVTVPDFERDVAATAEYIWTSALFVSGTFEFCSVLNAAIRSDHVEAVMHAVVFTRAINLRRVESRDLKPSWFSDCSVLYPSKLLPDEMGHGCWRDGVGIGHGTWRGGGFRDEFRSFFKEGKRYRVPAVLATSMSKDVALRFVTSADRTQPRVLWCIKVDGRGKSDPRFRCKHASYVNKTLVTGEGEFLFAPYSAFRVEQAVWSGPVYEIVVSAALDNKAEPEDLPLTPWY